MIATVIVGGLVIGVFYALLALGYGLLDSVGGANLGYGDAMVLAAFVTAVLSGTGVAPVVAVLAGVAASVVAALATERVALRPLSHSPAAAIVATVGIALVWRDGSQQLSRGGEATIAPQLQSLHAVVAGVPVDLATGCAAALLAVCVALAIALPARTRWGHRVRAVGDDRVGAALVGIAAQRAVRPLHIASGFLGATVGLLLVAHLGVLSVSLGWQLTLVGFVAATLGGRRGPVAAAAGGLALGVLQTAVEVSVGTLWAGAAALAALALVLILRPSGFITVPGARA